MNVDYLIVGGGVAGCALGWRLRQAGARVLVLELRNAREKDKLCGGILGVVSINELVLAFGREALYELALVHPPHHRYRCLGKESVSRCDCATVLRKQLDDWLLARYIEVDGEVRDCMRIRALDQRTRVVSCQDIRTGAVYKIAYGVLVGADGALSKVRQLVTGRLQNTVMGFEGMVRSTYEDIVFAYDLKRRGYCWYIPSGAHANVGCMLYGEDATRCRAWLSSFCEDMGMALPALRGAPIPTGEDILLRADEHVFLVGDAAGLASPIDGGGIHFALASARMLAASLLGGDPYEDAMRPIIQNLTNKATNRDETYLLTGLRIAGKAG